MYEIKYPLDNFGSCNKYFLFQDELSGDEMPAEIDDKTREKVRLKEWLHKPDVVTYYECQEIDENRKTYDRFEEFFCLLQNEI